MKTVHKQIIAATVGVAITASVAMGGKRLLPPPTDIGGTAHRIGPDYLYPNPKLTPGKADTLSYTDLTKSYGGQTYSQSHRFVSASEKNTICLEYPLNCKNPKEIDHFYPLCAGGSNDVENLWAQPEVNQWNGEDWGFHKKDILEARICVMIKSGNLDPKIAFQKVTSDWVAFYREIIQ